MERTKTDDFFVLFVCRTLFVHICVGEMGIVVEQITQIIFVCCETCDPFPVRIHSEWARFCDADIQPEIPLVTIN